MEFRVKYKDKCNEQFESRIDDTLLRIARLLTFLFSFSAIAQTNEKEFYLLKERRNSLSSQVYSIYLAPIWGQDGLLNRIAKLNNTSIKGLDQYTPGEKIWIPSPHTFSKFCNFLVTKDKLVTYKYFIKSGEEKLKTLQNKGNLNCQSEQKDPYENFIFLEEDQLLSSMIYSIYLTPLWEPNGIMQEVYDINHMEDEVEKDNSIKSIYMIPELKRAQGFNYARELNGRVKPKVYINSTPQRLALLKLAGGEKREKPKKKESKIVETKVSVLGAQSVRYSESDVSNVTVDILSTYGGALDLEMRLSNNAYINFYAQLEYFPEVKNRDLDNNYLFEKNLSYEDKWLGGLNYTAGFSEPWYIQNIEKDVFKFVSSIVPYAGLAKRVEFESFTSRSEVGLLPPLDLINQDLIEYGVFLKQHFRFKIFGQDVLTGADMKYIQFKNHADRYITLFGGLSF